MGEDLKFWGLICSANPEEGAEIKEMIKNKLKTEALRTYLFAYASIYDAFHLDQLVDMFELPARGRGSVHAIVSKMMIKEEITAFWDESSNYVLMQHSEPSPLRRLALNLADRSANAVDQNERLITQKTGDFGLKDASLVRGGRWDTSGNMKGKGKGGKGSKGGGKGGNRF